MDDQSEVREGQRIMLDAQTDITVVGEARTGQEALQMARNLRPDVVVIDVRMPGMDGITATGLLIGGADWPVRVIVMTTFDLDEYVFGALRLGASGFLLKTTPLRRLPTAVREVHAGETMLSSDLTQRLVHRFASMPAARRTGDIPEALSTLTPRSWTYFAFSPVVSATTR
ncbi:MAG: response regulator transcription factor [Pedococcus sp.]